MSNSALDALAVMGIEPESVDLYDMSAINRLGVDRRICMCGHAMDRHKLQSTLNLPKPIPVLKSNDPEGPFSCVPNAQACSCRTLYPVLKVSNTKYFLKKTTGSGELHALTRGIRALAKVEDNKIEWLVEPTCLLCGFSGPEHRIVPATFNANKTLRQGESIGYDDFVCQKCRLGDE